MPGDGEAQAALARLHLLAEAGDVLARPRDVAGILEAALGLLVPRVADWAMIYLRDDDGGAARLAALRHPDRGAQDDLADIFGAQPVLADDPTGMATAIRTGETQVLGTITGEVIDRFTTDDALRARLRALRLSGSVAVPLVSRGQVLGLIGVTGIDGVVPGADDLALIDDVAARIALAIDNAHAYARVRQQQAAAEEAGARLSLLAQVGAALGVTLDVEDAVSRLAQILVPALADWCLVTLLDDNGELQDAARWHVDADRRQDLDSYVAMRREALSEKNSLALRVLRTGVPVVDPDFGLTVDVQVTTDAARDVLARLDPASAVIMPITGQDGTLGAITMITSSVRPPLSPTEVQIAAEIARRAGLALENARLFQRQRRESETFQRSLLTDPVAPDHLVVVSRYVPAVQDVQVGGDWYDAFVGPDGITTLVIGDVMGHDTSAAAAMAQLRTLLRGLAVDRPDTPAGLLRRVDRAARELTLDTYATAMVAQMHRGAEARGHVLHWASAGHPPALMVLADGTVQTLEPPGDLLLGLEPDLERTDRQDAVPDNATVLMFTDGLVERRDRSLEDGLCALRELLPELARIPVADLCDAVLARMLPTGAEDDVALVAVRPRPER